MRRRMRLLVALATWLLVLSTGCTSISRGRGLSSIPREPRSMFLSTGAAPGRTMTLGFVQVRGYGVETAGFIDAGEAGFDSTIRRHLSDAAAAMDGDGVVNIEFLDENPSTTYERSQNLFSTVVNSDQGVKMKDRYVTVTGEVIRFVD